ncbi:hypothetical protein BD324DRAFT_146131 [Kockovaella imperatae]|uniref:polynucleotide adenylyltransferase n=1 Tax=Kockovaella imperatae TaxID=4999 RepID=A0A1Y1U8P9_9TREE|nr:hypothetical protein BD324DRAFT_146131 [Kockovaella imperatae]ORX34392.1 hypothetical protein BD324DRAFT_146131 [Kockovaella imperatae]
MHPGTHHRRFLNDLSSSLFSFVLPLLPTNEELTVKEEVRGLIEKLIKTIEPSARLLSFGSSCNSFGLRNSDMDLVVLIDDPDAGLESSHLVAMMGDLLERETNFDVKPLPKARIPILKLTLAPSPALPFGIACDIGIENRLAIENTRLLLTYATIDPARVRTLVLFLKVWAKRRRINSPYRGTLSSYGFTLMVLYYLVHVKQPPVLPNLQRIAPVRPLTEEQVMLQGRNVYFFDDVETLRQEWSSINFETVGELFFSHDFQFNNSVLSIRAGPLTKESKGWVNDIDVGGLNEMARDRNRLCIEDPFEITYNVARTVTKDGLYTIRGEFMRATRILTQRPDRAVLALAELCQEREEDVHRGGRSSSPAARSLSNNRGGGAFTAPMQNGPWRSQSLAPYDRMAPTGLTDPFGSGPRRGRQSEGDVDSYTAQEQWLASQGPNLGGMSTLGFGLDHTDSRGRDNVQRGGHETPGYRGQRRAVSAYEPNDGAGSGSISAPLSPHRLYAQLEMGKGPLPGQPNWSTSVGYDPRSHSSTGLPVNPAIGSGSSRSAPNRSGSSAAPGSAGLPAPVGSELGTSPPPAFAPWSPDNRKSLLQPLNGEPASYISPSTLLSPPQETKALPPSGDDPTAKNGGELVDALANNFEKMGVSPPGRGSENPAGKRFEEAGQGGKA